MLYRWCIHVSKDSGSNITWIKMRPCLRGNANWFSMFICTNNQQEGLLPSFTTVHCEPDIWAQDWCGLFITSHKLNMVEWITPPPPATLLTIETAKFCKQKKIHMKCLCRINNIIVVFCFLNNVQNALMYNSLTFFFIISFSLCRESFCNLRRFQLPNFTLLPKSH